MNKILVVDPVVGAAVSAGLTNIFSAGTLPCRCPIPWPDAPNEPGLYEIDPTTLVITQ